MNRRSIGLLVSWLHTPLGLVTGTGVLVAFSWLPPWLAWINLPMAILWPGHCARVALFGRRGPSTVPPLALSAIGSFALWPLVGLAIASTGTRVTHLALATGIAVSCLAAAAWSARRARKEPNPSDAAIIRLGATPKIRWVAVASIAAMLLGAWATVRFIPRPKAFEFSSIAFSGTWALTRTPVVVDTGRRTVVLANVRNDTDHDQVYRVAPAVTTLDGHVVTKQWRAVTVPVPQHSQRSVEVSGEIPVDDCYQQLRLTMTSDRGPRSAERDIGANGSVTESVENDPGTSWEPITALVRLRSDRCDRTGTGG